MIAKHNSRFTFEALVDSLLLLSILFTMLFWRDIYNTNEVIINKYLFHK